jgi:hypothetical protein
MNNLVRAFLPRWSLRCWRVIRGFAQGKFLLSLSTAKLKQSANLETLSGKIRHKMAFDRSPQLTVFADKVAVREYVGARIGQQFLPQVFDVFESSEDLLGYPYPTEFALKANHGSGAMILVSKNAPRENKLPRVIKSGNWEHFLITPSEFEVEKAKSFSDVWLKQSYYYRFGNFPEWAYKDIQPKMMLEEIMLDMEGRLPWDYKFMMIHGECAYIQVRGQKNTRDLFDVSWNRIKGKNLYPESTLEIQPPQSLREMLEIARELSRGVDFIRVDLYETSAGVKFGELTNYPDGGIATFDPPTLDRQFGALWKPDY